jgi:PHD/YefM family antitoxin component YafN of YafNO toxin-antitoxin module
MNIQIATNNQGKRSAVIIPFREWELLQSKINKLETEQRILLGINDAMQEVKAIIKGKKNAKTLQSFLNEL